MKYVGFFMMWFYFYWLQINLLTLQIVDKIKEDDVNIIVTGTKKPKLKRYTLYPMSSGFVHEGAQLKNILCIRIKCRYLNFSTDFYLIPFSSGRKFPNPKRGGMLRTADMVTL